MLTEAALVWNSIEYLQNACHLFCFHVCLSYSIFNSLELHFFHISRFCHKNVHEHGKKQQQSTQILLLFCVCLEMTESISNYHSNEHVSVWVCFLEHVFVNGLFITQIRCWMIQKCRSHISTAIENRFCPFCKWTKYWNLLIRFPIFHTCVHTFFGIDLCWHAASCWNAMNINFGNTKIRLFYGETYPMDLAFVHYYSIRLFVVSAAAAAVEIIQKKMDAFQKWLFWRDLTCFLVHTLLS